MRMSPAFWILLELRMMEVVVTTGAIRRAKLQQSNTQLRNAAALLCVHGDKVQVPPLNDVRFFGRL